MENKIIAHVLGGAATHISDLVLRDLSKLGEGFPKWEFYYADTTEANVKNIELLGKFKRIENKKLGDSVVVDGSGSDRSTNVDVIVSGVKDYINEFKFLEKKSGEYHFVFFSMSGGTSSVMGPLLIQELLKKDICVICVGIADSSSLVSNENAMKTLESINNIVVRNDKTITMLYYNNYIEKGEKAVNNKLYGNLKLLSAFLSGNIDDIDNKDMELFFQPSNMKHYSLKPGILFLDICSKDYRVIENTNPIMVRELTLPDMDSGLNIALLHYKKGYVVSNNAKSLLGDVFPIYVSSIVHKMEKEYKYLKDTDTYYKLNMMSGLEKDMDDSIPVVETGDENGLVI